MLMQVKKAFRFSRDGVTSTAAAKGEIVNIPANLVNGLSEEGYIEAVSDEGKMLDGPPENKAVKPRRKAKRKTAK